MMNLSGVKAILADLDGTVNRGNMLIPGVKEAYDRLSNLGIKWLFLSNNASCLDRELATKLENLGLAVTPDQVVTSATALLKTIMEDYLDRNFFIVGEESLIRGIVESGGHVTEDPDQTDIVVTALDRGMTYEKIRKAHWAIQKGARFWATNLDPTFPVENGFHPGAGTIAAAVATAAGRPPDRLFGKPSPDIAYIALERLGYTPSECVVVGDRMDTDILFARNAGLPNVLVLTGAGTRESAGKFNYTPDFILDHIKDIELLL